MIEYLDGHIAYWHWIVFGIVSMSIEMFAPTMFFLLIGTSAIMVGIIAFIMPLGFSTQVTIWAGLSLADTFVWFKVLKPIMKMRTKSGMALEQAVGQTGMVTKFDVARGRGVMRFTVPLLGQEEWTILSQDPISPGETVRVDGLSGNSLLVSKSKEN